MGKSHKKGHHSGSRSQSGHKKVGNAKTPTPALADQTNQYTSLSNLLEKYELVEVAENNGDPFVIVSERGTANVNGNSNSSLTHNGGARQTMVADVTTLKVTEDGKLLKETTKKLTDYTDVSIGELGSSSASPFTSFIRREYNNDLVGIKGLQAYDKMRKSDGTVKGTLRSMKAPVLTARWFMTPKDKEKVADVNAAEYVWKNLTEMSITWPQFLIESLLMCEFGYYMFEIVWEQKVVDGKERLWIKKLAPRHPMDVWTWHYDANGGPAGVTMLPPSGNMMDAIDIPMDKLVVFTFDREAGDIEGISVLRSAYKHWYYMEQLYKIDAIQKERHGIGIPVIKLPPGFSASDKAAAEELGRNLRTNERAHVVLPPMWEIMTLKIEGHPVDCLASIREHKEAIRENILLGFMGATKPTTEDDQQMFYKATRFIADIVCETMNAYVIPKIMEANFQRAGTPSLNARRIGEEGDWRTLSFAIRNLIGAGALIPDDDLEEFLREQMDLPLIDKATRRIAATPMNRQDAPETPSQSPPVGTSAAKTPGFPQSPSTGGGGGGKKQRGAKVGLPRQGPPPSGKVGKSSGQDMSGTSGGPK